MMVFCDEHKPSQVAEMNRDELQLSVMASATSYLSFPACIERNFVFKGPVRDFFRTILAYVSTNSRFHHCHSWYNKGMRSSGRKQRFALLARCFHTLSGAANQTHWAFNLQWRDMSLSLSIV